MAPRVPWLPVRDADGHTFDPADDRHGLLSSYINHRCRCAACRKANTDRHREYMHANPDQQAVANERERIRRGR